MKTVIVMPVHNALPYTQKSLAQILDTTEHNPIVIIDDCSGEETMDYLMGFTVANNEAGWPVLLERNEKQQLFTRTANRGIRAAYREYAPKYIVVVNSDCNLFEGWLEAMEDLMEDPTIGIVGYRDSTPDGLMGFEEVLPPGFITGHCIMFRVAMLEEIGIYCETDLTGRDAPEYGPFKGQAHIGSDRFMSYRAVEAGFKSVYCNFNGCAHEAGKSWGHSLHWLQHFKLELLWEPCDNITEPTWNT
jgi:GT2 family glycosyltransferase